MNATKKVWLIGLDGASFEVLGPMIEAGKLPVLAGILKNGAKANLKSTAVPFTPQAWASIITGNNPGKHGVFGFIRQMPGQKPQFLSSQTLMGEKIWTRLGRAGKKCLVVNVPLTYPAEPLNGAMITGMMTPKGSDFTYPVELKKRILDQWPDYALDVTASIDKSRNLDILEEVEGAMNMQVEATMALIGETSPDFVFKVFVLPDRIQHAFCQLIHPGSTSYHSRQAKRWRERIWESYAKMDQALGRLVDAAGPDTNILFVSDHGFAVEKGGFYTNDFLVSLGILRLKTNGNGVNSGNIIRGLVRRFNLAWLKKFVPNSLIKKTITLTKEAIDWSQTKAYASPLAQQGININLRGREPHGIVAPNEYDTIRGQIVERLNTLRDPKTGREVVAAVRREEIFDGPFLEGVPDIVLNFEHSGFEAKDMILGGPFISHSSGGSRGIHHRDGFFAAIGPNVNPGEFDELLLEDIAPNILTLAGIEGSHDVDGRVRPDIFAASPRLSKKEAT